MDSSDKRESLPPAPAYYHQPLFRPHHLHQCLELSPHCPQHGGYLLRPNSRHHRHSNSHHLELSPDCPLHGHLLPRCPLHTSIFHSNSPNFAPIPLPRNPNVNSIPPEADTDSKSETLMMQDRNDGEDEDEFIFVLTDEWKVLFAKSEAKRRLAKKQAQKKGKD